MSRELHGQWLRPCGPYLFLNPRNTLRAPRYPLGRRPRIERSGCGSWSDRAAESESALLLAVGLPRRRQCNCPHQNSIFTNFASTVVRLLL